MTATETVPDVEVDESELTQQPGKFSGQALLCEPCRRDGHRCERWLIVSRYYRTSR